MQDRPTPPLTPRVIAIALLVGLALILALMAFSGRLRTRSNVPPETPSAAGRSETTESSPPVALGDRRYRGPDGMSIRIPEGWWLDKGTSQQLWGTLRPEASKARLPEIGVGSISAGGGSAEDAMEPLEEVFGEILPELPARVREEGSDRVVTGAGRVGDRDLVQVRWMRPAGERVLIAWGLFDPSFADPEAVVDEVIRSALIETP